MKKLTLNCSFLHNLNYAKEKNIYNDGSFADVWIIDLQPELKNLEYFNSVLTIKETKKVNRLYHIKDKERYIISKGILKTILSKYINLEPEEVIIESNENGKPFIYDYKDFITHFNLSHSESSIVVAISSTPVGADVEQIMQGFQYHDIVSRCFSEEEKKWMNKSGNSLNNFYLLWTRKEAIVKATSQGIDDRICHIKCLPGLNTVSSKYVNSDTNWEIVSHCYENYMFSIAYAKETILSFYNQIPAETY